jgi:hypothetical protein
MLDRICSSKRFRLLHPLQGLTRIKDKNNLLFKETRKFPKCPFRMDSSPQLMTSGTMMATPFFPPSRPRCLKILAPHQSRRMLFRKKVPVDSIHYVSASLQLTFCREGRTENRMEPTKAQEQTTKCRFEAHHHCNSIYGPIMSVEKVIPGVGHNE